jgi:hypothetical protein
MAPNAEMGADGGSECVPMLEKDRMGRVSLIERLI